MMDAISEENKCRFFDAVEDITSIPDANCDGREFYNYSSSFDGWFEGSFLYDVWRRSPQSVEERRLRFWRWMGPSWDQSGFDNSEDLCGDVVEEQNERVRETSRPADEFCSTDNFNSAEETDSEETFAGRDERRIVSDVDKMKLTGRSQRRPTSPSSVHTMETDLRRRNSLVDAVERHKKNWLHKLRSLACVADARGEDCASSLDGYTLPKPRVQRRVKVHHFNKQTKELSALYIGQDIHAHDGAILAMKFSPDGQYLASGGEDGTVRLWQVVEDERSNVTDIPEIDPSCIYFTLDHLSELKPLVEHKEITGFISTNLKKTSESACVIFPPKVFRIVEKPLHDYHGHNDEITDLSWSNNNYLLSSSVDKTVRLWRVGCDNCIKVFSHSDYVTCVQFNPVDDNYFISGSTDGKVRIWRISSCKVVDWTDVRDIVTAVAYRPDGEGGIAGSMAGDCRFYNISDNHMELDAQISFNGKKKSSASRKITGFQFFPQDSSRVVVTSADSHVRILDGSDVVGTCKGSRHAGYQISASFTADGKHIVSACGDSNVYLRNSGHSRRGLSHGDNIKSYEHFSTNASVAVPWNGLRYGDSENGCKSQALEMIAEANLTLSLPASFFPKVSTLWPEEKLGEPRLHLKQLSKHKSQHKLLKASCKKTSNSHAWGVVIVAAGWDGRIKSFHNYGLPSTA